MFPFVTFYSANIKPYFLLECFFCFPRWLFIQPPNKQWLSLVVILLLVRKCHCSNFCFLLHLISLRTRCSFSHSHHQLHAFKNHKFSSFSHSHVGMWVNSHNSFGGILVAILHFFCQRWFIPFDILGHFELNSFQPKPSLSIPSTVLPISKT